MAHIINARKHAEELVCKIEEKIDLMFKWGISEILVDEVCNLLSQLKSVLKNGKFCK